MRHRNQEKSSSGKRMRSSEIMSCVHTGTVTTTRQKWSGAKRSATSSGREDTVQLGSLRLFETP